LLTPAEVAVAATGGRGRSTATGRTYSLATARNEGVSKVWPLLLTPAEVAVAAIGGRGRGTATGRTYSFGRRTQ
jgi:hypothetical protein